MCGEAVREEIERGRAAAGGAVSHIRTYKNMCIYTLSFLINKYLMLNFDFYIPF
jgi:hypothetical protein